MSFEQSFNNTLLVHEVLELVDKAATREQKIELLRKHESVVLKNVLKGTFDDAIQWNLPGGKVPYQPAAESSVPSSLVRKINQLPMFVVGGKGNGLHPLKRESMFIGLLETIHPKDAEIVCKMINKKSPAKGVTKKLVQEAFPGLISK